VPETQDWFGGSSANIHYSPLAQINRKNVKQSRWPGVDTGERGGLQTSPIIVDGYFTGSHPPESLPLDAATGNLLWKFDPAQKVRNRIALAYWSSKQDKRIWSVS